MAERCRSLNRNAPDEFDVFASDRTLKSVFPCVVRRLRGAISSLSWNIQLCTAVRSVATFLLHNCRLSMSGESRFCGARVVKLLSR
jgi:hypothetical protein